MDGLQEIYYSLKNNKLRTFLTAFGVFWGIFMLIVMLASGRGMQNGIMKDFGSEVLNWSMFYGGETSVAYKGLPLNRNIVLTTDDVAALRHEILGVENIATEINENNVLIKYGEKTGNFSLYGRDNNFYKIFSDIELLSGRFINQLDNDQRRKVALIGKPISERLFGEGVDPIGKQIEVNGLVLTVVGFYYDKGNRGQASERIIIPLNTFYQLYGHWNKMAWRIFVTPKQGVSTFTLEQDVLAVLRNRHTVSADDRRAINSFNMATQAATMNGVFRGIDIFLWFVGLGTLAAGIVGISNIMIITVKERTKEIGIRKALGAKPSSIVGTLLTESILVTSASGYIGLLLAVGLIQLIDTSMKTMGIDLPYFKEPRVDFSVAISALLILVIAGTLAGLAPALRAAKISPIEAMRAD